jgi:hypothetical protein
MTPEEIMDKLEARVGPEGRKLFEQFRPPIHLTLVHAVQPLSSDFQSLLT